jgi:hypothetical protein
MDVEMEKIRKKMKTKLNSSFSILKNRILMMRKRICLLGNKALKDEVLNRAHESRIIVHPGNIKMYRNLKEYY